MSLITCFWTWGFFQVGFHRKWALRGRLAVRKLIQVFGGEGETPIKERENAGLAEEEIELPCLCNEVLSQPQGDFRLDGLSALFQVGA